MTSPPTAELDLFSIVVGLLGGLALFLYGMNQMADALRAAAGERMKAILERVAGNRILGVFTGAFVTAVIQSSSVTTVLTVGFVSAGLMNLTQATGIIMGANIGTTVTAQIIAFKITRYALLLFAAGFAATVVGRRAATRHYGTALLGLGLIFIGMGMMGDAMAPLRTWQPFLDAMVEMQNPLAAIAVATVFTAVVQSSSAATGIVVVLASQGLVTLEAGIALVLGTNVGTCITAALAAIGRPREAMRAAAVHVLFNIAGVLLWVFLIPNLAAWVTAISPRSSELEGMARLAADTPRQIANAHTLFNIANTLLFLPFAGVFGALATRLVPERESTTEQRIRARYLDDALLTTPALALDRCRMELERMCRRVRQMIDASLATVLHGTRADLEELRSMDDEVDGLHAHIIHYLGEISRARMDERQTARLVELLRATNAIEAIGDVIETNLVALGARRIESGVSVSEQTAAVVQGFHNEVLQAFTLAMKAVVESDSGAAQKVVKLKPTINSLADAAGEHEAQRLIAKEPGRMAAYALEVDILENYKRVYYFTKRAARAMLVAGRNGN